MENHGEIIFETESLCPVCLQKIPAYRVKEGQKVYLEKQCEEHGKFRTLIWNGLPDINSWIRKKIPSKPIRSFKKIKKGCPFDCGLCDAHRQHTCTALIEVTERCNLECNYCFAGSTKAFSKDPGLDKIEFWYKKILEAGGPYNIQISGGEPTVRDDLDRIIKMGYDMGFGFIQLNTNGIRLGEEEKYVKKLKKAGLDSVFLQFDGTRESIYKDLRGRELFKTKIKVIENLEKYGIGIILVPTIVSGVNDNDIGKIIDFAIDYIPVIRGIHFQPVSYFGRFPTDASKSRRVTIPDIIRKIEEQTEGKIRMDSFKAPG